MTGITELIERLDVAIAIGERTGAKGASPTNIYNLAAEARAALALSVEQEPVAWTNAANLRIMKENEPLYYAVIHHENTAEWNIPLYTAPPSLSTAIRERDEAREQLRYFTGLHEEEHKNQVALTEAAEALASQARADATSAQARIAALEALIEAQHGDVVVRTAKLLYEKDDAIADAQARIAELEKALGVYGEWAIAVSTLGELEDLEARMKIVGVTLQQIGEWAGRAALHKGETS